MKIALVHDYLAQDGGAERVLQAFHEIWPEAPIFVLFYDKSKMPRFSNLDIRESFIAKIPGGRDHYQWFLPFMPVATERHNLHDFDIVLSSTSAFAKGVLTRPETMHISYCHTPTRYLWTDTHEYIADLKYNAVVKSLLPRLIHRMRIWDKMSVDRVDQFIANSDTVRQRIHKYYRRDSDIIYPPVDTDKFYISDIIGNYFVSGGRIVKYKRFDLIVEVFNRLRYPIKIFGDGPELENLKNIALPNIEFLGKITDKEKADLLSQSKAFIHPQVEDLGITQIEAMASGRPVIAYPVGGASETVIPCVTGVFFKEQTWESLLDAVLNFDANVWNSKIIKNHAEKFSSIYFKERIEKYINDKYENFKQDLSQCRIPL